MRESEKEKILSHEELEKIALQREDVRVQYKAMEAEFEVLKMFVKARKKAHLTQKQVAERMGTKQESVARMETKLANGQFPSIAMMQKYATAVGKTLHFELR